MLLTNLHPQNSPHIKELSGQNVCSSKVENLLYRSSRTDAAYKHYPRGQTCRAQNFGARRDLRTHSRPLLPQFTGGKTEAWRGPYNIAVC